MPISTLVFRLLCATSLAVVMTPAYADDWEETPEEAWKGYLSDCQHMQRAITNLKNGSQTARDSMLYIESPLRTLSVHRKHLDPSKLGSPDYARCENLINQGKDIVAKERAVYDDEIAQHLQQAQTEHRNSPEYKRARALGFTDVGEIGQLDEHAELDGEENLKTLMITVDFGCGRHFRAAQYNRPYVIYTVGAPDGTCVHHRNVAVLNGKRVDRGDNIDRDGIFQYVGWKELEGADGFPVDIRVVKAID